MIAAPPVPQDEDKRLEALRSYALDARREATFDRITQLAAAFFEVPIALVSMMDENRQWFKSCFGTSLEETDRRVAFCAYAILKPGVLVVEDALLDSRFAKNPFVVGEPKIRFYAGAPLRTPGGYNIGTLCIIDMKGRKFSEENRRLLACMAEMVVDILEGRDAARRLMQEMEAHQATREELERCRAGEG